MHFCIGVFCSSPEGGDKEWPHLCGSGEGDDIIFQWFPHQDQPMGKQPLFKARGRAMLQRAPDDSPGDPPHPHTSSFISETFHSSAVFS